MTNEKHIGIATMYDNTHGNEIISIMNAISGILEEARSMGAEEEDCEECRADILKVILLNYREIKKNLLGGCFLVRINGGFMDVGYLLSLRF